MHFAWSFPIQMMSIYWVVIHWAGVRHVVMSHSLEAARPDIDISMTLNKFDKHKCWDSFKMLKQSENYELTSRLVNRFSDENWPLSFAAKVSQLNFIMGNKLNLYFRDMWHAKLTCTFTTSHRQWSFGAYMPWFVTQNKTKERGKSCIYAYK